MSETKHTPGPWLIQEGRFSIANNGTEFSVVTPCDKGEFKTTVANWIRNKADAELIAAAPELAEALRELHDWADVNEGKHHERSVAAFIKAIELLQRVGC